MKIYEVTFLNASCDPGALFLSGCNFNASLELILLIQKLKL